MFELTSLVFADLPYRTFFFALSSIAAMYILLFVKFSYKFFKFYFGMTLAENIQRCKDAMFATKCLFCFSKLCEGGGTPDTGMPDDEDGGNCCARCCPGWCKTCCKNIKVKPALPDGSYFVIGYTTP